VFFADTYDEIGPLSAKSMGEYALNPVAPAIANALADATGCALRICRLRRTAFSTSSLLSYEWRRRRN
jgi:CO/xanthine dehydrogenase Mo-binding subunit